MVCQQEAGKMKHVYLPAVHAERTQTKVGRRKARPEDCKSKPGRRRLVVGILPTWMDNGSLLCYAAVELGLRKRTSCANKLQWQCFRSGKLRLSSRDCESVLCARASLFAHFSQPHPQASRLDDHQKHLASPAERKSGAFRLSKQPLLCILLALPQNPFFGLRPLFVDVPATESRYLHALRDLHFAFGGPATEPRCLQTFHSAPTCLLALLQNYCKYLRRLSACLQVVFCFPGPLQPFLDAALLPTHCAAPVRKQLSQPSRRIPQTWLQN